MADLTELTSVLPYPASDAFMRTLRIADVVHWVAEMPEQTEEQIAAELVKVRSELLSGELSKAVGRLDYLEDELLVWAGNHLDVITATCMVASIRPFTPPKLLSPPAQGQPDWSSRSSPICGPEACALSDSGSTSYLTLEPELSELTGPQFSPLTICADGASVAPIDSEEESMKIATRTSPAVSQALRPCPSCGSLEDPLTVTQIRTGGPVALP